MSGGTDGALVTQEGGPTGISFNTHVQRVPPSRAAESTWRAAPARQQRYPLVARRAEESDSHLGGRR